MEGRETLFAPKNTDTNGFRETTLKSGWQPVIKQKPQIYKRVSTNEAFRKKGLLKQLSTISQEERLVEFHPGGKKSTELWQKIKENLT